jgi:uncharacterized protein (TIGR02391 family)
MNNSLKQFENIVRLAREFTSANSLPVDGLHPFDERNIHPRMPIIVKKLFDDGYYAQATFEAFKFLDKEIQRFSGSAENGYKLMMQVFSIETPIIRLNTLISSSDKDEQKGYQYIFSGTVLAIRNPRGHEFGMIDTPDKCLDHLSLASLLLRRLEEAGYK